MSPEDKNDNPIQEDYDKQFSPIKQAEKKGTAGNLMGGKKGAGETAGIGGVKKAEEDAGGGWKNKVSGGGAAGALKPGGFLVSVKKRSPIVAIIITLLGGGFGMVGLLSPSLLVVQIKEVMVNKFDNQLTSMSSREISLYSKKMGKNLTKGVCTSVGSILCKYETMSSRQVANFEKAGIKVNYDKKSFIGRAKPTSFEFKGQKIDAKDFVKTLKSSSEFRSAVHLAFNVKFAGFADAIWAKAAAFLGIAKKAANISGNTDEERLKSIQEDTSTPALSDTATAVHVKEGDPKPGGGTYSQAEAAAFNAEVDKAAALANDIAASADTIVKDGVKAAPEVISAAESVGNTLKVTGWMDTACTAYKTIRAVGFAAKTVRALQLARYAMIFLNVADQIKAGTAKPEDVSYLGKILTTEFITRDKSGNILSQKSATNSFGYNFAAYGTRGTMSNTATQFLAGGGLTGDLIHVTSLIDGALFGTPKKTCNILGNPLVSAGSLIAGIGLMLIPGVNAGVGAWDIAKGVAAAALNIATQYLPALLKDIVAGVLVDKTTVGEAAGDAITSGSSGIMGTAAKTGGNAPLTPAQAVAYNYLSGDVAQQYAQEDRLAYSPLDASNSNTFMGMIVGKLIPYASNMSSLSGILSSIASITTGSFASLTSSQTAKAASTDDYTMCQDYDYRNMGLATDPYCNVTYGIPSEALNADPIAVTKDLIGSGQIDETTGDPVPDSEYATFVTDCIDRTTPLGDNSDGSDGSECLFSNSNKNYYIHYIDQRVQTGLDEGNVTSSTDTSTTPDTNPTPTTGDAQQLAKEILANNKINLSYVGSAGVSVRTDVQDAAKGKVGSAGAMTSTAILELIATIGRTHSVSVSAIQSGGMGHSTGSLHYSGDAVDFSVLDGKIITGRNSPAITIINIAKQILPTGSGIGQSQCGPAVSLPSSWSTFPDTCNHLHVQVPKGTP